MAHSVSGSGRRIRVVQQIDLRELDGVVCLQSTFSISREFEHFGRLLFGVFASEKKIGLYERNLPSAFNREPIGAESRKC